MMPAPKRYLRAAPRYLPTLSRHRIKIRSRSPLRAVPGCRFFMRFAVSGRLCRVILTGERHETTDKFDARREKISTMLLPPLRASGKKLNQPNRHIVLNRARAQIESQRARQNGSDLRVRRSGSRRNLPGRVRGRRVADCHFRRFCGEFRAKQRGIHSGA